MTALWIAVVALALLAIVEAFAIVALAREVGLLSRRLPPAPALESTEGLEPGTPVPPLPVTEIGSREQAVLTLGQNDRPAVVMVLSTRCSLCRNLLRDANGIRLDWPTHDVLLLIAGPYNDAKAMVDRSGFAGPIWQDQGAAMRALNMVTTRGPSWSTPAASCGLGGSSTTVRWSVR